MVIAVPSCRKRVQGLARTCREGAGTRDLFAQARNPFPTRPVSAVTEARPTNQGCVAQRRSTTASDHDSATVRGRLLAPHARCPTRRGLDAPPMGYR